jgi:hypothetical protein
MRSTETLADAPAVPERGMGHAREGHASVRFDLADVDTGGRVASGGVDEANRLDGRTDDRRASGRTLRERRVWSLRLPETNQPMVRKAIKAPLP